MATPKPGSSSKHATTSRHRATAPVPTAAHVLHTHVHHVFGHRPAQSSWALDRARDANYGQRQLADGGPFVDSYSNVTMNRLMVDRHGGVTMNELMIDQYGGIVASELVVDRHGDTFFRGHSRRGHAPVDISRHPAMVHGFRHREEERMPSSKRDRISHQHGHQTGHREGKLIDKPKHTGLKDNNEERTRPQNEPRGDIAREKPVEKKVEDKGRSHFERAVREGRVCDRPAEKKVSEPGPAGKSSAKPESKHVKFANPNEDSTTGNASESKDRAKNGNEKPKKSGEADELVWIDV